MSSVLTGGCHCGAVRYEARGETSHAALCHCTDCRKVSGAPALAWFTVAADDFAFTAGTPIRYASSDRALRQFCGACGAQLTFAEHAYEGKRIDVTACSLDDPEAAPPRAHIYTQSRIGWMARAGRPSRTRGRQRKHPSPTGRRRGPSPSGDGRLRGYMADWATPHPPNRFAVGPLPLPLGEGTREQ